MENTFMPTHFPVERLVKRFRIPRWMAVAILKEIGASGAAEYKIGRKGWPTRLQSRRT